MAGTRLTSSRGLDLVPPPKGGGRGTRLKTSSGTRSGRDRDEIEIGARDRRAGGPFLQVPRARERASHGARQAHARILMHEQPPTASEALDMPTFPASDPGLTPLGAGSERSPRRFGR
jgi:hypothetical protein